MKVYFISGLSADERAFERIILPKRYEIVHINWLPVAVDETLKTYALRMAESIDEKEPFILAGLSFGGIVAVEIAKVLIPRKLILFSSISTQKQLPWLYKLAGKTGLTTILPVKSIKSIKPILYWFFGASDTESKQLIDYFINRSEPGYLKWAISKIACWDNQEVPQQIIQIHGSKDKVFPVSKAEYVIKDAGHLCVFTHSNVVNEILIKVLTKIDQ